MLAIDIGNTHTRFAILQRGLIVWHKALSTDLLRSARQAQKLIRPMSQDLLAKFGQIRQIGVASVVPQASAHLLPAVEQVFSTSILNISAHLKLPFKICYKTPETLGADRIALLAFARLHFPKQAVIAIDFGTAITYDILRANGDYLGGMILAGMHTAATALSQRAAQLPTFDLPYQPRLIGRSTIECLQSGTFWGTVAQTDGLIARLKDALQLTYKEPNVAVLATGGDAKRLATAVKAIDAVEQDAVLFGIRIIAAHQ